MERSDHARQRESRARSSAGHVAAEADLWRTADQGCRTRGLQPPSDARIPSRSYSKDRTMSQSTTPTHAMSPRRSGSTRSRTSSATWRQPMVGAELAPTAKGDGARRSWQDLILYDRSAGGRRTDQPAVARRRRRRGGGGVREAYVCRCLHRAVPHPCPDHPGSEGLLRGSGDGREPYRHGVGYRLSSTRTPTIWSSRTR